MPTYNSVISRNDAGALIPEDVSKEIFKSAVENSSAFRLARRLPDMPRAVRRLPVLDVLPVAYFVSADTGLKQTSEMNWTNKYLYAEELAVIVPIPETVRDDVDYDIWSEVRPSLAEAFGLAIDQAVFYGTNKPANWPNGILTDAGTATQTVSLATFSGDLYDAILGENGIYGMVEQDGFDVSGSIGALSMRSKLRGLRDANGQLLFTRSPQDGTQYELDGRPILFPRNGAYDPTQSLLIAGDFAQMVYSFRQDITFKMITEGVITDNNTPPQIIYNLPQQDMVALRAVMRVAWAIPNPVNRINSNSATRYPFAVLTA